MRSGPHWHGRPRVSAACVSPGVSLRGSTAELSLQVLGMTLCLYIAACLFSGWLSPVTLNPTVEEKGERAGSGGDVPTSSEPFL